MKKYYVEMVVAYRASLEINASDEDKAISKAKNLILDNPRDYFTDENVIIFDRCLINNITEIK